MPPKRKDHGNSDEEPKSSSKPAPKKSAPSSGAASFPGQVRSSSSRSQEVGLGDGGSTSAPAGLKKLNDKAELKDWVVRAEKELAERYPGERIGVTKTTNYLRKKYSLNVVHQQVETVFTELHPEDDTTRSRDSSASRGSSGRPDRLSRLGVLERMSSMSISGDDNIASTPSDRLDEIEKKNKGKSVKRTPWHWNDQHVKRVIEIHDTLSKGALKSKKAGLWVYTAEKFGEEFKEFAEKPNLAGALKNLYYSHTRKPTAGVNLNKNGPDRRWEAKHIDFTEEAIGRDESWKDVHESFMKAFPDMEVTLTQLAHAHIEWSFVRRSEYSLLFSAEDRLELLRFRTKYNVYGDLTSETLVPAHRALRRPKGSEVTDAQIRRALKQLKDVSVDEWKQKMIDREAEVIAAKAKRVERNKKAAKEKAEYNRKRVEIWIEMYTAFGEGRTSQSEAARQIMKSKRYREVYHAQTAKIVQNMYQDLKKKKVTIEYLQGVLAEINAGVSDEALNEIVDALDDTDSDLWSLFGEDDEALETIRAEQDDELEWEIADAEETSTEMGVYLQQIQLRARLGGKSPDAHEGSIEARVRQQQLQARLDIEILSRSLLGSLDKIEIAESEAYRNWLQLGDNVPKDVFDELDVRSWTDVHAMLEERKELLVNRRVRKSDLQEVAKLDTLHHDYLTLWEDDDPQA